MIRWASGSIHVVTKVARLRVGMPSSTDFLAQQAHGIDRRHADLRQLVVGRVAEQEGIAVAVAVGVDGFTGRAHRSIKPQPPPQLITRRG